MRECVPVLHVRTCAPVLHVQHGSGYPLASLIKSPLIKVVFIVGCIKRINITLFTFYILNILHFTFYILPFGFWYFICNFTLPVPVYLYPVHTILHAHVQCDLQCITQFCQIFSFQHQQIFSFLQHCCVFPSGGQRLQTTFTLINGRINY